MNLPTSITLPGGTISYAYTATGSKIQKKIVQSGQLNKYTFYAGNFIYGRSGDSGTGTLEFFSHPEGYVSYDGGQFNYVYNYLDHLGNVRLSYTNTGSVSSPNLQIVEENNYYPFGLKHQGYNTSVSSLGSDVAKKFKYNGKELNDDFNLNWFDYGSRNYDAALARFLTVDPKTIEFDFQSPYAYAVNNPIFFIDKDGEGPWPLPTGVGIGIMFKKATRTFRYMADGDSFTKAYAKASYDDAKEGTKQVVRYATPVEDVYGVASGKDFDGNNYNRGEAGAWAAASFIPFGKLGKLSKVIKSGKWVNAGENMSDAAASFQKQITGVDASQSFKLDGVKFDGVTDTGVLLDAKSGMENFVAKDGNFTKWFKGADGLLDQANRQLKAAEGAKIQWHFENKSVMEATQNLFKKNDIQGIELIYTPRQ